MGGVFDPEFALGKYVGAVGEQRDARTCAETAEYVGRSGVQETVDVDDRSWRCVCGWAGDCVEATAFRWDSCKHDASSGVFLCFHRGARGAFAWRNLRAVLCGRSKIWRVEDDAESGGGGRVLLLAFHGRSLGVFAGAALFWEVSGREVTVECLRLKGAQVFHRMFDSMQDYWPANSAMASATRSILSAASSGYIGKERISPTTCSALGKSPGLWPRLE